MSSSTIDGTVTVRSPKRHVPIEYLTRTDTNDGALVFGIINDDEYRLAALPFLRGTAIDVGAHIGTIAIALAVDNRDLQVIAVEIVPENTAVLRANIEHVGLGERITVVEKAAAAPGTKSVKAYWNYRTAGTSQTLDQPYVDDSRFIANIFEPNDSDGDAHTVKAVSLDTLMDGLERLALLKVDCEGCEWAFLRSPRVADVDIIIGEYHNGGGLPALVELIGATHEVRLTGGAEDIGTFRADRR